MKRRVGAVTAGMVPFAQRTSGIVCTKNSWLFINLEKNRTLQALSEALVHDLAPLRSRNQSAPAWLASYPEKLECFDRFGSPNVFLQFDPHITLLPASDGVKLKRFVVRSSRDEKLGRPVDGQIVGVGISLADAFGQMKQPLSTFLFK